jgi:hypothetical protein
MVSLAMFGLPTRRSNGVRVAQVGSIPRGVAVGDLYPALSDTGAFQDERRWCFV